MKRQFEDFDKLCFLPVVVRWLHDFLSKRRLAEVEKCSNSLIMGCENLLEERL